MLTPLKLAVIGAILAALSPCSFAQKINLDIGRANAEPSIGYGAAAGQAGIWNRMVVTAGGALVDTSGLSTGASVSAISAHHFSFGFDNPFTTGDDELLLDAGHDGALALNFSGLQNGDYFVYTYAFAPDNRTNYITDVEVLGSTDPIQSVGGTQWSGIHIQGVTYAKHHVSVTGGTLQILATVGHLYATVNGVQLEPLTLAPPIIYCTPKTNSLGCTPTLSTTGTPSASANSGFTVTSAQNRNDKWGLLLYTMNGQANGPFQGGILCLNAPINRTIGINSYGTSWPLQDCTGMYTIDMNSYASGTLGGAPLPALLVPGNKVDCQWWGRDPGFAFPDNTSLSAGLEYTIGL